MCQGHSSVPKSCHILEPKSVSSSRVFPNRHLRLLCICSQRPPLLTMHSGVNRPATSQVHKAALPAHSRPTQGRWEGKKEGREGGRREGSKERLATGSRLGSTSETAGLPRLHSMTRLREPAGDIGSAKMRWNWDRPAQGHDIHQRPQQSQQLSGHQQARVLADERRAEYLGAAPGYRGVLGFAWLVLTPG